VDRLVSRYRVGIIGLSGITAGERRVGPTPAVGDDVPYTHAAAYDRFPNCEVVAVADLDPERRTSFRRQWGSRWPALGDYESGEAMLAAEPLDIVSVATPDHLHTTPILQACRAGVRGILCEKPLATSLKEADQIIQASEAANVHLVVDHTQRWLGSWQDALRELRQGTIGELKHILCFMGGPRAMLFRNGTHQIDLINFLAQSDPVWVSAEIEPGFEQFAAGYRGSGGHDANSEPGGNASIAYANGVRATYIGMKGMVLDYGATLFGTTGKIQIDSMSEQLCFTTERGLVTRALQLGPLFVRGEYQYPGISGAVHELLLALEGAFTQESVELETPHPPRSSAREARKTVAILLGMLRSHARNGARVPIPGVGEDFPPL
jgi:predicted dehydrogenase